MSCTSGCPAPGTHETWGDCLRAKRIDVAPVEAHRYNQSMYRTQDEYRQAREDGLQPESVSMKDINFARKISDATGEPFRADAIEV